MTKKMLIDASQSEENRVAIVENNKMIGFDFESTLRKQLKGNIYLAKVTRVEPSLQAAFVEYGGNRHGFLAFSEIHPDYYRIPIEDREALLKAEEEIAEEMARTEEADDASDDNATKDSKSAKNDAAEDELDAKDIDVDADVSHVEKDRTTERVSEGDNPDHEEEDQENEPNDVGKLLARRLSQLRRKYAIQEVIERRQIMLIQVVKEERGNKGAAVTTHISLPGRYCVLMPNSPSSGGVSRKISTAQDRKRLRDIIKGLDVPKGMSVIVRTAGQSRTKAEIKRDFDYLMRLWNDIRKKTLESTAPSCIYEEADLCLRAIRDNYSREMSEVLVEGDEAYARVRDLMKMLTPSHAKKVKHYKDPLPLFQRYQVETAIGDIFNPHVDLPSGGSIVINQTEALVAIDVNSGRATRERNIDETALATNLEAAEEIARQLRLRDLGGLVVIDFIDMDSNRHNMKVERKLKEAMSGDRARIEIGRISAFGLLELSRQRLRPSLQETHYQPCSHCNGTGLVRTVDSAGLIALRELENAVMNAQGKALSLTVSTDVGLYILNEKRGDLQGIEQRHEIPIRVILDPSYGPNDVAVDRDDLPLDIDDESSSNKHKGGKRRAHGKNEDRNRKDSSRQRQKSESKDTSKDTKIIDIEDRSDSDSSDDNSSKSSSNKKSENSDKDDDDNKRGRRRRGRRGGRNRRHSKDESQDNSQDNNANASNTDSEQKPKDQDQTPSKEETSDADTEKKSSRRRGGRGRRSDKDKATDDGNKSEPDAKNDSKDDNVTSMASKMPKDVDPEAAFGADANADKGERRGKGWWQKLIDAS